MSRKQGKLQTLRADAIWNVLGSLIYSGCQWGILVATVKLSSPADVGRLSLAFALSAPVFLLFHLRLRAATATDAQLEFSIKDYVWLRVIGTALAFLCTAAICLLTHVSADTVGIVLWVAAAKTVESGSDLIYGIAQRADGLRSVAISMTARGVLGCGLFATMLAATKRLDWALAGLTLSWLAVFLVADLPVIYARNWASRTMLSSWKVIWRLTVMTLPLGLSTMLMSLTANMPRYFIQHSLGLKALGIFSAAGYLTMTVSIIISAIAESSIAGMSRLFAASEHGQAEAIWHRVLKVTLLLSAVSIVGTMAFGQQILRIVYRADYASAAQLLTGLMIVATVANIASVNGYALLAARRFMRYLMSLSAAAVATAAACAVLVPRHGGTGAVFACLLGYAVQCGSSWWYLRNEIAPKRVPIVASQIATPATGF